MMGKAMDPGATGPTHKFLPHGREWGTFQETHHHIAQGQGKEGSHASGWQRVASSRGLW